MPLPTPPIVSAGRIRQSPFHEAVVAEGAESFVVYNRMLIPRGFGDREAEYWRLINDVSMWDVAAQRVVQIQGPDAGELVQALSTRDLSNQDVGQGKYVALCNHSGQLINDPIVSKVTDNCYWLSIADSDIWMWSHAVAGERGFHVEISEPDVSPLAIQGPKAEQVVTSLLGDHVRDLKYFWFKDAALDGIPLKVARSGWSKQGGFELYLLDQSKGTALWNLVKEAGQPHGIGPGYPNPSERTESGLLNWDADCDLNTNPFEVGMERFVDLTLDTSCIGIQALRSLKAKGIERHRLGIKLDGDYAPENQSVWHQLWKGDVPIGKMTNQAWSYRLQQMIGLALVSVEAQPGDSVLVEDGKNKTRGELVSLPFL